jgi:hypothetical protein
MATTLLIRGAQIDLHESEKFNKVKHRIMKAKQRKIDYENGSADEMHTNDSDLQFFTDQGGDNEPGRIFVATDDCFGCMSDERKDGGE